MKFPLSWLKRYLDTTADAQAIADALTRLGLEVEGIENPAAKLAPFVIARVLSAERHPQTAHMFIINPLSGQGFDNLFSTHPDTGNRIAALMDQAQQMGYASDAQNTPWGSSGTSPARGPWG